MSLTRLSLFTLAFGLGMFTAIGCDDDDGDGGGDIEAELCERFDECNALRAGQSVQDCTDERTMCTDGLVTSAREDWNREINECLQNANCNNFIDCYAIVPDC